MRSVKTPSYGSIHSNAPHGQETRVRTRNLMAPEARVLAARRLVVADEPQLRPGLLCLKDRRLPLPRQILKGGRRPGEIRAFIGGCRVPEGPNRRLEESWQSQSRPAATSPLWHLPVHRLRQPSPGELSAELRPARTAATASGPPSAAATAPRTPTPTTRPGRWRGRADSQLRPVLLRLQDCRLPLPEEATPGACSRCEAPGSGRRWTSRFPAGSAGARTARRPPIRTTR